MSEVSGCNFLFEVSWPAIAESWIDSTRSEHGLGVYPKHEAAKKNIEQAERFLKGLQQWQKKIG